MSDKAVSLADFSDKEIREEYEDRFDGLPDDGDISSFPTSDLLCELEDRGALPSQTIDDLDEIGDLIAEAAHMSRHAAKAYSLLREQFELPLIEARQRLIAGRMRDAA